MVCSLNGILGDSIACELRMMTLSQLEAVLNSTHRKPKIREIAKATLFLLAIFSFLTENPTYTAR